MSGVFFPCGLRSCPKEHQNTLLFSDVQVISFRLNRKTYPKFRQISSMGCVIKTIISEKRTTKE